MDVRRQLSESWSLFKLTGKWFWGHSRVLLVIPGLAMLVAIGMLSRALLPPLMDVVPQGLRWDHPQGFAASPAGMALSRNLADLGKGWGLSDYGMAVLWFLGFLWALIFVGAFFSTAFSHLLLRLLKCDSCRPADSLLFSLRNVGMIAVLSFAAFPVYVLIIIVSGLSSLADPRALPRPSLSSFAVLAAEASFSLFSAFFLLVMINEEVGPRQAARRTLEVFEGSVVEKAAGYVGIELVFCLLSAVVVAVGAAGVVATLPAPHPAGFVVPAGATLAGLSLLLVTYAVFSQLYYTASYLRCVEGVLPGPLDKELMDCLWTVRREPAGL